MYGLGGQKQSDFFFQFITFMSFSFKNHIKVFSVQINETKAQ